MKTFSNEMALDQLETKQMSYFRWEGKGVGARAQSSSQRQRWPTHPTGLQSLQALSLSLSHVIFHQKSVGMILEALGLSLAPAQVWISTQQTSLPLPIATPYRAPTGENRSGNATGSEPAVAPSPCNGVTISAWLGQSLTPTITV